MKKILLVPLDERPCNYDFPRMMPRAGCELVLPPKELMGQKKRPADTARLRDWLMENAAGADAAVLAVDTLVYGGIVPSRLHAESAETLKQRADVLRRLREAYPKLTVYAFQLIMRCPTYSSNDEEPDYYEQWGREIFLLGRYEHLEKLGRLTPEEAADREDILSRIDMEAYRDYTARRSVNLSVLEHTLNMVKDGVIDHFVMPQDDSSVYGFTALDQIKVRGFIREHSLHMKINMYPSADDTGMSLLARAVNELRGAKPNVYVHYASSVGGQVVPDFEDRMVDETVKHQILAAGCRRVYSLPECDILLAVNVGSAMVPESDFAASAAYDVNRNLAEFVETIRYAKSSGKLVAVGDIARANGSDMELLRLMQAEGLLFGVDAYAGWNTSSNTLGTVLCESVLYMHGGDRAGNCEFLLNRYLEDACYCSHTRAHMVENELAALGLGYFDAGGVTGRVADMVKAELLRYCEEQLPEAYRHIASVEVSMPWARMFEVDVKARARGFDRGEKQPAEEAKS